MPTNLKMTMLTTDRDFPLVTPSSASRYLSNAPTLESRTVAMLSMNACRREGRRYITQPYTDTIPLLMQNTRATLSDKHTPLHSAISVSYFIVILSCLIITRQRQFNIVTGIRLLRLLYNSQFWRCPWDLEAQRHISILTSV